jgi:HEAT repeat protein
LPNLEPAIDDEKLAARSSEVRLRPTEPLKKKSALIVVLALLVVGFFALMCCGGMGIAGFVMWRSGESPNLAYGTSSGPAPQSRTTKSAAAPTRTQPAVDENKLPPSHWIAKFRDGDTTESTKARNRLLMAGALAVPDLRKALSDRDTRIRLACASLLGDLGDLAHESVSELAKCLSDEEPSVRETAALSLGRLGKPARSAYADLVRTAADANPRVRSAAIETLRQFGPPVASDVPKLLPLVTGRDAEARLANAKALADLKPDRNVERSLFSVCLNDAHPPLRLFAIRVISAGGAETHAESFELLLPLLEDRDSEIRVAVLAALRSTGPATEADLPRLQTGMESQYPESRRFCIESIVNLGPKATEALPALARALRDSDSIIRIAASAALATIGKPAKEILQSLFVAQNDRERDVRRNFYKILAAVGREKGVVDAMFTGLNDPEAEVRAAAATALKGLQPPLGSADLVTMYPLLTSPNVDVRRFAASEFARMGKESEPVFIKLQDALKDEDPEVRASLYVAFGAMGAKSRPIAPHLIAAMKSALLSPDDARQAQVFRQAAMTLTKIGETNQALPLLRAAMQNKNSPLLKDVLTVLAETGPESKAAAPELVALLDKPALRSQVSKALSKIGPTILDELVRVLDRGNREEKLGAISAIEMMGPAARSVFVDLRKLATTHKDKEVIAAAKRAMLEINR